MAASANNPQLARLVRQLPPAASLTATDSAAAAAAPPESVIAYKPVIKTIRSDKAVPTRQAKSGGVEPGGNWTHETCCGIRTLIGEVRRGGRPRETGISLTNVQLR
jgi:hypothetical protein